MKRMQKDSNMLEEYDFSKGLQGKYAKKYNEGTTNESYNGTANTPPMISGVNLPKNL